MPEVSAAVRAVRPSADDGRTDRLRPELDCVIHGLKPAARHTLLQRDTQSTIAALERLGLYAAFFMPGDPAAGIAYLGRAERNRLLSEPRGHLLYSCRQEICRELLDAHLTQDNERIGRILGYPACCVEANLLYDGLTYNDYVRVARVSGAFAWQLNIFIGGWSDRRGRQFQLLSHFPCSLTCQRSLALAEARLQLIARVAPDLAQELRLGARTPILLHDDSRLPPERRTGLCGAALHAIELTDELVVAGWRRLRDCNVLPDGLAGASSIRSGDSEIIVGRADRGDQITLPRSEWMLLLPR